MWISASISANDIPVKMRIVKLYIEKYKKYTNQTIIFDTDNSNNNSMQLDLFNKMNITLLSGENGSGKTTILSFISLIFRYLQRYREQFPCDYVLTYEINHNDTFVNVELSKIKDFFIIRIDGQAYIIQNFDLKSRSYTPYINSELQQITYCRFSDYKQVTYDEIKKYLPENIYVLGFDSDYKTLSYNGRYFGDRIVEYRDISLSYKTSGIGSYFSEGILNILYKSYTDKQLLSLLDNMGIRFSPYVDIYLYFSEDDFHLYQDNDIITQQHFAKLFWDKYIVSKGDTNYRFDLKQFLLSKLNHEILSFFIQNRMIYINEFFIIKGDNELALSEMSTGEKVFLSHLFFISSRIRDNSVLIWEEPETHLNTMWSRQLIPLLSILFSEYNVHFILSSHDTSMINSLFANQILVLKGNSVASPNFNTFLANDVEIVNNLFNTTSNFNYFEEYIISKINYLEQDNLKEMLTSLGNSFFKLLIYKKLDK